MEPATAGLIGTGIKAASSLVGGLLGDRGGLDRDAVIFQRQEQRRLAKDLLKDKFKIAQSFGIHPLAAAGIPMSTSTLTPVTSEGSRSVWGAGIEAAGNAAGDFAREALADEDELRKLQMEKVRAEIERTKAETAAMTPKVQPGPEIVAPGPRPSVFVEPVSTGFREYDVLPVDQYGRRFITLPNGQTMYPNTYVTPTEIMEGVFGEIGGEVHGTERMAREWAPGASNLRKAPDDGRVPEWWPEWLPHITWQRRESW